jgi:cardiolipin synthase
MNHKSIIFGMILLMFTSCASYGKMERVSQKYTDPYDFLASQGIPEYRGNLPSIYFNGTQWYDRALQTLAAAEDYILLFSFLTTESPRTTDIFRQLKAAQDRGVRVYIMVDSSSYYRSYPMTGKAINGAVPEARSMGLNIIEYNPIRGNRVPTLLHLFNRDHRKFWIVDGDFVSLGGQNIDYDSLRDPGVGGAVDTMVEIPSPGAIRKMIDSFALTWNSFSLEKINPADFPVRADDSDGVAYWLIDQHLHGGEKVTDMFDAFFSFAQEEIWMVQCYAYPTPALLDKIQFALDRGVRINMIVSDNHVATRFYKASYYSLAELIKRGVKVYFYSDPGKGLLHYKMIMADDSLVSIGSANYNLRSQTTSRELSVIFHDPRAVKTVKSNVEQLLLYSREVTPDEAQGYRKLDNFLNFLLMQFWG